MVEMIDKKHPFQKQITTIKKYWSCHTIKDYCIKFKNDIRKDIYDKSEKLIKNIKNNKNILDIINI